MMKATYPIIVHPQDETGYHFVEIQILMAIPKEKT